MSKGLVILALVMLHYSTNIRLIYNLQQVVLWYTHLNISLISPNIVPTTRICTCTVDFTSVQCDTPITFLRIDSFNWRWNHISWRSSWRCDVIAGICGANAFQNILDKRCTVCITWYTTRQYIFLLLNLILYEYG